MNSRNQVPPDDVIVSAVDRVARSKLMNMQIIAGPLRAVSGASAVKGLFVAGRSAEKQTRRLLPTAIGNWARDKT